jgi:ERCC4-related helicase
MLIDNKRFTDNQSLYEWFAANTKAKGRLDVVTGFFSLYGLRQYVSGIGSDHKVFRLVIGDLTDTQTGEPRIVRLLNESGLKEGFEMINLVKEVIAFLKRDSVQIRTLRPEFCHAKTYIYHHAENGSLNYYTIGSANLTKNGLGIDASPSANIELNYVRTGNDSDFKEAAQWFESLWKHAKEQIEIKAAGKPQSKISYKEHLIREIESLYRSFSPKEIYYKILYELFKDRFDEYQFDPFTASQVKHLERTVIYQKLYDFQKKGVLSLIRMLQKYNGAVLADAVGLGKTWSALAVMKFFEIQGYRVLMLCPKKLEQNWRQYQKNQYSIFEADQFEYMVYFHTDMQVGANERLRFEDTDLSRYLKAGSHQKLLVVIDESHNLRNDKSARWQTLVQEILQRKDEVKVLLLSATPINNKFTDLRNQFKLLCKGKEDGFSQVEGIKVSNLQQLFGEAEKRLNEWIKKGNETRSIRELVTKLPVDLIYKLIDRLVVARTRKFIERTEEGGAFRFPEKNRPMNVYVPFGGIGNLTTEEQVLKSLNFHLSAYQPATYTREPQQKVSAIADERYRQQFLVKMMYILLIKRLESSWFALKITAERMRDHHQSALEKVDAYIHSSANESVITDDETLDNQLEEAENSDPTGNDNQTLGKRNPVKLSDIKDIHQFRQHLETDLSRLNELVANLNLLEQQIRSETDPETSADTKLQELLKIITEKQSRPNPKVIIFTAFADTAQYLFDELKKRGYTRLGLIKGSEVDTTEALKDKKFQSVLKAFAPQAKIYKENDYSHLNAAKFEIWKERIYASPFDYLTEKEYLNHPIDILIATDCISEGQNLQDADMVINYDIHWNPTRLIQRMGRIDRLGSPNATITGVNFWLGKDLDAFLNLKNRVEKRMALLSVVGAELDAELTPELSQLIADNPLITEQEERMIRILQESWENIEVGEQTLGLDDLTLEAFRQELYEELTKNKEKFEEMPNGCYSGFRLGEKDTLLQPRRQCLVVLMGFPAESEADSNHKYEKLHLALADGEGVFQTWETISILRLLRDHKELPRHESEGLRKGADETLNQYVSWVKTWLEKDLPKQATNLIGDLFSPNAQTIVTHLEQPPLEPSFQPENLDLIAWLEVNVSD